MPIDEIRNAKAIKPSEYRLTKACMTAPRIFPDMYPAPRAAKIELIRPTPQNVILVFISEWNYNEKSSLWRAQLAFSNDVLWRKFHHELVAQHFTKINGWIILKGWKIPWRDCIFDKMSIHRWIDLKFSVYILDTMDYIMTKIRLFQFT